jgi:hypothetical protein
MVGKPYATTDLSVASVEPDASDVTAHGREVVLYSHGASSSRLHHRALIAHNTQTKQFLLQRHTHTRAAPHEVRTYSRVSIK